MSITTIQCKLVATETTRRELWHLMAEKHTPLINELLKHITQEPQFEEWCHAGKIPLDIVSGICQQLKQEPQFIGLPGRFYSSAIATVHRVFKSWLALQTRLRNQIAGQTRWLAILQSDDELTKASQTNIDTLRVKANEFLMQLNNLASQGNKAQTKKSHSTKKSKQESDQERPNISSALFKLYWETEEILCRCAIAYLLKNGCKLPVRDEDPKKFEKRRRKIEIRLERLTRTLQRTRIPKGRDLSWCTWLETLDEARTCAPEDENQAADWQAKLLTEPAMLPFPINYETNEDLRWFLRSVKLETDEDLKNFIKRVNEVKPNCWLRGVLLPNISRETGLSLIKIMFINEILDAKSRLCVKFSGLSDHSFEIYCDQRDLHWFNRFLDDQEIKKLNKNQNSTSLFTLRSGRIAWQKNKGKGKPWNVHRLVLSCTVDTDTWTQEGTEQIRQKKANECAKVIAGVKTKENLNKNQEAFIKRREKMLTLLDNPFPRPSRPLYQGQPSILAGVSYGLDKPATLAIVDIQTGKAITYRSIKQLLGESYKLLNQHRLKQQRNAHQRHKNQQKGASNQIKESNLGEHLDRLIAHEIVAIAQKYRVSSLILPDLNNIREVIQSEVQARAEQKILGSVELQRQYALQYRMSVHRWRYAQLSEFIQSQAAQIGISTEIVKQPSTGTPQEKAKNLALIGYQSRK